MHQPSVCVIMNAVKRAAAVLPLPVRIISCCHCCCKRKGFFLYHPHAGHWVKDKWVRQWNWTAKQDIWGHFCCLQWQFNPTFAKAEVFGLSRSRICPQWLFPNTPGEGKAEAVTKQQNHMHWIAKAPGFVPQIRVLSLGRQSWKGCT